MERKKVIVRLREDVFDVLSEKAEENDLTPDELAADLIEDAIDSEE